MTVKGKEVKVLYRSLPNVSLPMTDVILLALSSLLIACIGLNYARKKKTMAEYALANKELSLPVSTFSFIVTFFSLYTILSLGYGIYEDGLISIISHLSCIPLLLLWGYALYKFFDSRFDNCSTIGDMFRHFFGTRIEVTTSIIYLIWMILSLSIQLSFTCQIISFIFGDKYNIVVWFLFLLMLLYTAVGGVRAVVLTDIMQFIVIAIILPVFTNSLVNNIGGIQVILSEPYLHLENFSDINKVGGHLYNFFKKAIPFALLFPTLVHRFLMTPNKKRKKYIKSFSLLSLISSFLVIILAVQLAFSASYIIHKNDTLLVENLTNIFLSEYTLGILLLCFGSIMMATMDSIVNSASILLVKNILPKSVYKTYTFTTLFLSSLIVGGIAGLLSFQSIDLTLILPYIKSIGLMASFSLFLSIIRFKIAPYTFWISVFVAIITTSLTEIILSDIFLPYQNAFLRNFLAIILLFILNKPAIHFKRPIFLKKNTFSIIYEISKRGYNYFCKVLYDIPPVSNRLLLAFSVYLLVFILLPPPAYSFPIKEYQFLLIFRTIGVGFVLGIVFRSLWNGRIKLYYPIFLHIGLTYCLIFLPTFCLLSSNFSMGYVVQTILGSLLLTFMLHGINTLWVFITGNILTILFHYKLFSWENISFSSYNFQITIYALFFIAVMLSVLFKIKDKMLQKREKELISLPEKLASNIGLAYLGPHLFKLRIDIIDLKDKINKDIKNTKLDTQLQLDEYNKQFDQILKYAQDELGYELVRKAHLFAYKDNQPAQERYYSVQSIISTATDIYTHIHIKTPHDRFVQLKDIETDFVAFAHPKELSHLIWCIIENLIQYDKVGDVKIIFNIEKEPLSIKMTTTHQLIPIEEMEDWINSVFFDTKDSVEFGMGIVRKKLYEKYRITVIHNTTVKFNEVILRCPKVPLEVVSCLTDKFGRLDFVNSNLRNPKRFSPWK